MNRLAGLLVVGAIIVLPGLLRAVFIAPHAVFIDDERRAAEVTLGAGDDPEEVTLDLAFGFPDTDTLGTPFLRFVDDPDSTLPSAAHWIRAFPRRVRLAPGERRTLRLLATPPDGLPDGEYWARLVVTSRGASVPIASTDTAVRAGVNLVFRIVVPVTYRKGPVTTGIALTRLEAGMEGDSLVVWLAADRLGNAAYLGTAYFDVLAASDRTVREWRVPLAVYYPIARRFNFRSADLPAGEYRLALRLAAVREDLEEQHVLPAPLVADTVSFTVR